ncbi:MBL fold metallo-hydrolase [Alicyclobacillus sp. ALC3]|uniref:MBL fold metallo-hydrolase n=1 Tax=Alicyclobacillus sp. ALC3 TaxID=2796143 RepID=UPI0023796722|nr:MBL fold metallo-hydrolase [Alicyclobacillus sp. ALC3]WDL96859.1 MBL fold metallo-hydrolase [Alicyclobacillus sp. ALC3]
MTNHAGEEFSKLVKMSQSVWQWAVPTPTLPPAFVTNTYLICTKDEALLVDFGSTDDAQVQACVDHLQSLGVNHVIGLVATHYHRDHTDGLPKLAERLAAPIYVQAHDLQPAVLSMHPDDAVRVLPTPETFNVGGDLTVAVVHKPGHTHGHVHLVIPDESAILVGDHLAGDGSVWIGPPDGHMQTYYDALAHIASSGCQLAGPGHGNVLQSAAEAAEALLQRRLRREEQICATLPAWRTTDEVFAQVYGQTVAPAATEVARRTLMAHLQRLVEVGRVERQFTADQGFQYRIRKEIPL